MNQIKQIAIVDDHPIFRKGLSTLINLFEGYNVLFAVGNGKEMIKEIRPDLLPDVVFIDITMPEMDGYESAAWLRINYPAIKAMALSTMDTESAIIKMIRNGCKGYILKDIDPDSLKYALDEVITQGYFFNDLMTRKILRSINQFGISKEINFSIRELEFIKLACSELTFKEIADRMNISVRTAEGYRDSLCDKLNLKTRLGIVIYAIKNKIFTP